MALTEFLVVFSGGATTAGGTRLILSNASIAEGAANNDPVGTAPIIGAYTALQASPIWVQYQTDLANTTAALQAFGATQDIIAAGARANAAIHGVERAITSQSRYRARPS